MNAQSISETTGFCNVKHGNIYYKIFGAEKPGTPLICIHGGPGGSHDYLLSMKPLAENRPVIFYDQLGCGNSDKPEDTSLWTIEHYTEELKLLIEHLNYEKVILLGQSWGAVPAVGYYLANTYKVKALVLSGPLISSALFIEGARSYLPSLPENIRSTIIKCEESYDFSNPEYQEAMTYYYNLHLCRMSPWHPLLLETFGKLNVDIYNTLWGPSEFACNGSLLEYDKTSNLNDIKIPVLYTCGEFDEAAPYIMQNFQKQTPGSELAILKDCSHSHHLEKTDDYNYIVNSFINKVESTK